MTPTPEQNAKRVIELSEKATKGPWFAKGYGFGVNNLGDVGFCHGFQDDSDETENGENDALLIATYRTAAPELARAYLKLETELQQLRLAADGMRDAIKRAIDGYQDVPEIPDGHSIMEISFGEFRQMTNALLAYRAAGEGTPKDTGTSRE